MCFFITTSTKLKDYEVICDTLSAFLVRKKKHTKKASNNKILKLATLMIGIASGCRGFSRKAYK